MTPRRPGRVRAELDLWRISWQQVETFLDRVLGARDDDHPYAVRCAALHDAAIVLERLRLRRDGAWMPHPLRMRSSPGGGSPSLGVAFADRKYELPGPLDVEMAAAGLVVDDDGKPRKSPPKAALAGSEKLFDVWAPDSKRFVSIVAPEYAFGRLLYPPPASPHPWIPGLVLQAVAHPELGANADSDDSVFSFPRRKAAAEEGFAVMKPWSELRALRLAAIETDLVADQLVDGEPAFTELRDHITSGQYAQARSLAGSAKTRADADALTLTNARALLADADPEDDALPAIDQLRDVIARERSTLASLRARLQGSVSAQDRVAALALVGQLPAMAAAATAAAGIYAELDLAIAERVAYPDGPLRGLRVLEVAMIKMWRARAPWFAQRRGVLARRLGRFFATFERNLTSLVQSGATELGAGLVGARVAAATAAGADKLPVTAAASAVGAVRAGELAVLGGARPALAVILGPGTPTPAGQRLSILPLRVSQERGVGLDGVPGLVAADAPLGRTVTPPLTGAELQRGARAGEPEADALAQDVVALWSRLKLLRGTDFATSLPAPFDGSLSLPVHATADAPLPAHASRLLLPTAPFDAAAVPPRPLVATPGEVLLVRGRDADGAWWQGVVEVASSQVTTMEAEGVAPERDPDSPICCEPETPVVLVTLAGNTLPVDLVGHVTAHREFRGFGWPSLAVGALLPAVIDPRTESIAVQQSGSGFRFVIGGAGTLVDRTPELEAAAVLVERWTGGPGGS